MKVLQRQATGFDNTLPSPISNQRSPKWQHLPTKAIRLPEIFLQEIADFARKLDNGEFDSPEPNHSITTIPAQPSAV